MTILWAEDWLDSCTQDIDHGPDRLIMTDLSIISIVGPESSGKTTLSVELAKQLGGAWLPEYARSYLSSSEYTELDLEHITHEQIQREIDFIASILTSTV